MNSEVKTKWLEALRNGEYKQGKGFLRNSQNQYCCLGVLCDLHAKATGGHWSDRYYKGSLTALPKIVAEWAGVPLPTDGWTTCDVKVGFPDQDRSLMMLNDGGLPFTAIADQIEKYL